MGIVFLAFDDRLGREVALKMHTGVDDAESTQRWLREARALARLSHPNIVQIYEVGEHEGSLFIAMERLAGSTLREWVKREQPSWQRRLEVLVQAGRGLQAAHAAGLVHRDVKPDNIVVGDDGRARVVDFGLVRDLAVGSSERPASVDGLGLSAEASFDTTGSAPKDTLTAVGAILGTPAYMAPEQQRGQACDALADQYAFSVTAFEVLHGVRPFHGRTLVELAGAIEAGEVAEIADGKMIPRRVRGAIVRGLAPDPAARWPDLASMLGELERGRSSSRTTVLIGGLVIASTLALGWTLMRSSVAHDPCPDDPLPMSESRGWDRIRAAFQATGLPSADSQADAVIASIGAWSTSWTRVRREVCEATRVAGIQSDSLLDQRMNCLSRLQRQAREAMRVLEHADEVVVGHAAALIEELPDPASCRSIGPTRSSADEDTGDAAREAVRDELARVRALAYAGKLADAQALLDRIHPGEGTSLELLHDALAGEMALLREDLDRAVPLLLGVARRAAARGDDDLEATVRARLALSVADRWSRPEQERWIVDDAAAAVARLGREDDPRSVDLEIARGHLELGEAAYGEAIAAYERARSRALADGREAPYRRASVALAVAHQRSGAYAAAHALFTEVRDQSARRHGARSVVVAHLELNLGLLALDRGDHDAAEHYLSSARATYRRVFGATSLEVARASFAEARLAMDRGDVESAGASLPEIRTIYETALGADHHELGQVHNAIGVMAFYRGEHQASLTAYSRALDIAERVLGPNHEEIGLLHANIGESMSAAGDFDGAVARLDTSIAVLRRTLADDHRLLAIPLKARGRTRLALGLRDEGIEDLEQALTILHKRNGQLLEQAETRIELARALVTTAPERAKYLGAQARSAFAALGRDEEAAAVDAWLDANATNDHNNGQRP